MLTASARDSTSSAQLNTGSGTLMPCRTAERKTIKREGANAGNEVATFSHVLRTLGHGQRIAAVGMLDKAGQT